MKKLFLLLILLLILASCNKGKELGEYLLGDLKNENPYIGNETLVFLDNNGDSLIFFGEGRYSEVFQYKPNPHESDNYYVNELDVCNFSDKNNINKLKIALSTHLNNVAQLTIGISNDDASNQDVSTDFAIPLEKYFNAEDSLLIGGNYYDSIYCLSWYFSPEEKCCYSVQYGIVKFEYADKTWELKEVIP